MCKQIFNRRYKHIVMHMGLNFNQFRPAIDVLVFFNWFFKYNEN